MVVCRFCHREMTTAASCDVSMLHLDRLPISMIPWAGKTRAGGRRCPDCGVGPGGFHHLGCDMQRCAVCRGQMITCGCRFDEDPDDDDDLSGRDLFLDRNGCFTEVMTVGGREVIVHYDDIPESDITVVDGIRVTTALRTVIDLATSVSAEERARMIDDCLRRGLFTIDEGLARVEQPDLQERRGAQLVRDQLLRPRGPGGAHPA